MKQTSKRQRQEGFSLIELMVSVAVFTVLCGAAFGLLNLSLQRQQTESVMLDSFQEARLGLDQIVRDANDAGYPPANEYTATPAANTAAANFYAASPVAWNPTYPLVPCTIGGTCISPGNFDLIIETDIDPPANNGVEWVRYKLVGTTLFRGVASKAALADPVAATDAVLFPYVRNVMNNASAAQIGTYIAAYPAMFPGGNPVPIFSYFCDPPVGATTGAQPCTVANNPTGIRDIGVTLIVLATQADAQTNQPRLVELNGRGHRINPNR